MSVVRHLSSLNLYKIRAITRDTANRRSLELASLPNVQVVQGDLLKPESLNNAFKGVYGIFGNTTPTKLLGMDKNYELIQGYNLIKAVKAIKQSGHLKHFIFSSICKGKNNRNNIEAPAHFLTKWELEKEIKNNNLSEITTILRPASYFENFSQSIPGVKIHYNYFPGILNPNSPWQTIAVDDIGLWTSTAFKNPKDFINKSLNLAGEELTGNQMAKILKALQVNKTKKDAKYVKIPRIFLHMIEHDIAIMAHWIEEVGYDADFNELKILSEKYNIKPTKLVNWLNQKIFSNDKHNTNRIKQLNPLINLND